MEKCYVNGMGQYWYNISGKQALDAYCRVHEIHQDVFENLLLRICNQLELLEWNLIDSGCLVVDPELIFVNHSGEEISFVLYPEGQGTFGEELLQLMEYLLTKLKHDEGVHQAYKLYNMVLTEGYSLEELKKAIRKGRKEAYQEPIVAPIEMPEVACDQKLCQENERTIEREGLFSEASEELFGELEKKMHGLITRIKEILGEKVRQKEEIPMVVNPEDEIEPEKEVVVYPTVCLSATLGESRGVLVYEGRGEYPDFELGQRTNTLGKHPKADLFINRETVSQFHAKFDYFEKSYYIEDLNSTNGTFVNDEMLNYKEKRVLSPGDVIRFADVKYRFM